MKLTKKDVLYIFSQRAQVNTHESNAVTSRTLAIKFGISERTVRDIWSRRSRRHLTQSAWTVEEVLSEIKGKRIGRPPGVKDAAPRQRHNGVGPDSKGANTCSSETTSDDGVLSKQGGSQNGSAQASSETTSDDGAPDTSGTSEDRSEENGGTNSSGRNSNQGQNENGGSSASHSSPEPQASFCGQWLGQQSSHNDQILNYAALSQLNQDLKHCVSSQLANTPPIQMRNKIIAGAENSSKCPSRCPQFLARQDQLPCSPGLGREVCAGHSNIGSGCTFPSQYFQSCGAHVSAYNQQATASLPRDIYFKNANLGAAQAGCSSTMARAEAHSAPHPAAQLWANSGHGAGLQEQGGGGAVRPREAGALSFGPPDLSLVQPAWSSLLLPRQLDGQAAPPPLPVQLPFNLRLVCPPLQLPFGVPQPPSQLHDAPGFSRLR